MNIHVHVSSACTCYVRVHVQCKSRSLLFYHPLPPPNTPTLPPTQNLKPILPSIESVLNKLIQAGNDLLASVGEGSEAESSLDDGIRESQKRWYELVQSVDDRERAVQKVVNSWRAYSQCYDATRTFITEMTKIVGTEPVESSEGKLTVLPMYRVCTYTVHACYMYLYVL